MHKILKISAVANNFILILALFILRYSEVFRGQNPLYVILKTIGWALLGSSIIISIVTIVFILLHRSLLKNKILWITLSSLPLVYISIIVLVSINPNNPIVGIINAKQDQNNANDGLPNANYGVTDAKFGVNNV